MQEDAFHTLDPEATAAALRSNLQHGLSESDAGARLIAHGHNCLPAPPRHSAWQRLALQFHNILIYILLGSASVTALLGHWVDACVILGVVCINATIGFIQENKAEAALAAIGKLLSTRAQVLRDGQRMELTAELLVPGDIVFIAAGDRVPADLRLADAHGLRVDEAILTGESVPADKSPATLSADSPLAGRSCMAYSGTLVSTGQGMGIVTATGRDTEIGRISLMLESVQPLDTPLLRKLNQFGHQLSLAILALAVLAFAFGTQVQGFAAQEMFMAAVGIAVAAIPEGMPAIVTITLAIGVRAMAQRRAIVRHLPAVEALGSVTVICTDKTGTLTRNEMAVQVVLTSTQTMRVSGTGYAPYGGFMLDGQVLAADSYPLLPRIAQAALLCNDATLTRHHDQWQLVGDPTEGALLALAMKAGLDLPFENQRMPRTDVIPFESEHRFMATLHHDHQGHGWIMLKGAPERLLPLCSHEAGLNGDTPIDPLRWHARSEPVAMEGMRLLALAAKPLHGQALHFRHIEAGGFTLLGLLGLSDPPRDEAVAAVARCRSAGIDIRMITGDHALTATAIGRQLGLVHPEQALHVMTGPEMDALHGPDFAAAVLRTQVFARASPEHKLRIVEILQAAGHAVAMTGDGVNDAPALKRADVGIAMGNKGTEAAREAAEIVLTDDNFASIAAAVEEGRRVYDNIRKAIVFTLPTNLGEAGMLLVAILFGLTLPITPVQILWVNMVTEVTLSMAIAFEKPESNLMQRPPQPPGAPLLSGFTLWRIGFVSTLMVAGALGLYLLQIERGASLEQARTVTLNAIVIGEMAYLLNTRYLQASVLNRKGLFGNPYVLAAIALLLGVQLAQAYLPSMQLLFGTTGIDARAWLEISLFGMLLFLLVELEKLLQRKFRQGSLAPPAAATGRPPCSPC